jgi:hypothetical protein
MPSNYLAGYDAFGSGHERIVEHMADDDFVFDSEEHDIFSTTVEGIQRPPGGETLIRRQGKTGRPYILPLSNCDVISPTGEVLFSGHYGAAMRAMRLAPEGSVFHEGVPLRDRGKYTFTRVTTFIDKIDEKKNIHRWEMRNVVEFLARGGEAAETFLLEAASFNMEGGDYKGRMDELCRRILERAGTKDRASKGTAVHAITELHDMGLTVGSIPRKYMPHLDAYVRFTENFEMIEIERFVVNDLYETGGTPDRVVRYKPCKKCGREFYIEDLKTGRVDNYTELAIAMQLALYKHSRKYNIETGERTPLPETCPHKGIVVHLPAHSDDPHNEGGVKWVNIARGWKYVDLCARIIEARNESNLVVPFIPTVNVWPLMRDASTQHEVRGIYGMYRDEFERDERLMELMELRLEELPA